MPINLDQTGPAHLLSTDEDGLILNGSPVISKSIHVSDIEPKTYFGDTNTKLLWLDTGTQGISIFPNGGAANYILRTDGNGTLSWIPPSSIDATKFHYFVNDDVFVADPGSGFVSFPRANGTGMSTTTNLIISATDKSGNNIGSFINALSAYGNNNRRGFIKIERENDPNHFQIFEFRTLTDNTTYFEIAVTVVRVEIGDENFPDNDPVSITFSPAGPEGVAQDLTNYVTLNGTQDLKIKTLTQPFIKQPVLKTTEFLLTGVNIGASGLITCDSTDLSNVTIALTGQFTCTATTFAINDAIRITGTLTGAGSITGYSDGNVYYVIATNGSTEFTLSSTLGGSPITTGQGSSTGLTFSRVQFTINDIVKIVGSNSGTGTITGYDPLGSLYFIISTNGVDEFTLSENVSGTAVTTSAGTVLGAMTFTSNVSTSITFDDGFSDNGYETKLTVLKNTADRKIILPDANTTLVGIDNTQTLSNKTIIEPNITDPDINLTYSGGAAATNITVSSGLATAFNTRIGTTADNQYSWTTNLYYDGTAWQKDDNARGAWRLNQVALTTDSASEIAVTYAPVGSSIVQDHLKIDGLGVIRLPIDVSSTDITTGTLVVEGGVGIGENLNVGGDFNLTGDLIAGSIQSTPIGTSFRETGAFSTLSATGEFEVTDVTESTSQSTGAAVITGGLGVGKAINAKGPVWFNDLDPLETKLIGYSLVLQGNQSKLRVGPNYTAGAADYIDIITDEDNPYISTSSDNFTFSNVKTGGNITLTATDAAVIVAEDTAATDKITGALQVVGGIGVSLDIHADDIYVYGQTGLANTASQVVSLAATQTLTNKTLTEPTIDDAVITGTINTGPNTPGLLGQLLSSTGTGVAWVNPVSFSAMVYEKGSDQNINPSGDVSWNSNVLSSLGSSFGSMNVNGIFTFSVAGTYLVTLNYSLTDINGGSAYPSTDFWIKKNNLNTVKYCQILTNGVRRGSVSEMIDFAVNDTLIWFVNTALRVNGGAATGSRITIIRVA
jgi:hypothetical protein